MIFGKCLNCGDNFRKREIKYKFCSLKCSNSFNKNGLIKVRLQNKNKLLAEFIGICLGDGYVSKYQTSITLNSVADKYYIPYVVDLMQNLFPAVKITVFKRKNENAVDIRLNSRLVSDFLVSMGIVANDKKIPLWIIKSGRFRKYCLKGLFDTEGSVSFKIYQGKNRISLYKQLNFKNTNKEIMKFVRDTLVNFGFKPTMTLKKHFT